MKPQGQKISKASPISPRTVYYWTLVLGQVAAALSSTTKSQPLFGDGVALNSSSIQLIRSPLACVSETSMQVMHKALQARWLRVAKSLVECYRGARTHSQPSCNLATFLARTQDISCDSVPVHVSLLLSHAAACNRGDACGMDPKIL